MTNAEFSGIPIPELTYEQRLAITAQTLGELSAEIMAGKRKMMPYPIFEGWAKGNRTPTLEIGMVQPSDVTEGGVNVYMLRRPDDDKVEKWRGKKHIPGSIFLGLDGAPSGDENDFSKVIERVVGESEGGLDMLAHPIPFGAVLRTGARGPEITNRLIVPVSGTPVRGAFYDVDTMLLPENRGQLLETHDVAIASVRDTALSLRLV